MRVNVITLAILLWLMFNRGVFGMPGYIIFDIICIIYAFKYGIRDIIIKYTLPLLLMPIFPLVIGTLGYTQYTNFAIFKDIYYFLNPIFAIFVGQFIAQKNSSDDILKALKLSGCISTIILSLSVILSIGIDGLINPREARANSLISANSSIILACSLFWYDCLFASKKSRTYRRAIYGFIICLLGVYFSGTRTLWISEIIYMIFVGWKYYSKHHFRTICYTLIAIIIGFFIITNNPDNKMVQLILNSSSEVSSKHSFTSNKEINENWRGYEAYRALREFNNYTDIEQILGHGFGTTVDVKDADFLGMRHIPILHNGYMYMLIKSGYLGIALLILWGVINVNKCFRINDKFIKNAYLLKMLCVASIIMLFVTNASVTCYVNAAYNGSLFLIGVLYYYYYSKYLKLSKTIEYGRINNYCKL